MPDLEEQPMLYHVTRNGQNYGPYTLEDLQRYVASGNVLQTDLAKSDEMPEWVPVSQVLGLPPGASMPAAVAPVQYAGVAPAYAPGAVPYPDPPNLHWALVLLIGVFTCGLFFIVWYLVQAGWMRKVNPHSNALFLYIGYIVVAIGGAVLNMASMTAGATQNQYLGFGASLVALVLMELAFFDMRRCMLEHFNGPEPIGLSLSGVMTFFFGGLYFQYHFTRINELKRGARYRGAHV